MVLQFFDCYGHFSKGTTVYAASITLLYTFHSEFLIVYGIEICIASFRDPFNISRFKFKYTVITKII